MEIGAAGRETGDEQSQQIHLPSAVLVRSL